MGPCLQESCEKWSTFGKFPGRGTSDDCVMIGNQTFCCLCMRGDASTRPWLNDPFNTTADMVAFLNSTTASALLPHVGATSWPNGNDSRPLMLGLDWGGGPDVDLFTSPLAPMIRGWLSSLQQVIAQQGLALIPYFDSGLNGMFQDLDDACFAGDARCTPDLQAFRASLVDWRGRIWPSEGGVGFPSPAQDPYGRFQVLNDDWTGFESDCNSSSWSGYTVQQSAAYPWLWWEQTAQSEFLKQLGDWEGCASVPYNRSSINTGTVLVSNTAPEMFEAYTSLGGTGRGANALFTDRTFKQPLLATVPVPGGANNARVLVLGTSRWETSNLGNTFLHAEVYAFPSSDAQQGWPADITTAASNVSLATVLPAAAGPLVALAVLPPAGRNISAPSVQLLAACANGQGVLLRLDLASGTLTVTGTLQVPGVDGAGTVLIGASAFFTAAQDTGAVINLLAVLTTAGNASKLAAGTVVTLYPFPSGALGAPVASAVVQNSFLADQGGAIAVLNPGAGGVTDFGAVGFVVYSAHAANTASGRALAARTPATMRGVLQALEGEHPHVAAAIAGAASAAGLEEALDEPGDGLRSYLYGAYLQVTAPTASNVSLTIERYGLGQGAEPVRIGFGSGPGLSLYASPFDGQAFLAVSNTDGAIDCGLLYNNGGWSRCEQMRPEADSNLVYAIWQSQQNLVTYSLGSLDAFRDAVNAPDSYAALSMCSRGIQHGKVEVGASAAIALFPTAVEYPTGQERADGSQVLGAPVQEMGLLMVHDGDALGSLLTTLFGGSPNPKPGLVWDQWHPVQPDVLALMATLP